MIAHIPESASARFVRRRDQHYRRRLRTVRPGLLGGRYAHMEPDALSKICPRRILASNGVPVSPNPAIVDKPTSTCPRGALPHPHH